MSDDFPSIEAAAAVTGLRGRVGLTMHSDGGPFAARLALFAGRLSGLSEMLDLSMASDGAEPPHLEMTAEGCGRLRFAVHPEGPELRPFLNAVGSFGVRDDSCIDLLRSIDVDDVASVDDCVATSQERCTSLSLHGEIGSLFRVSVFESYSARDRSQKRVEVSESIVLWHTRID